MKKILMKVFVLLFVCLILIGNIRYCSQSPEEDEPPLLTWDRSACKMLDYEINGDRITIRYVVRIVSNTPDADWRLSNFTLRFAPEAVSGWFQYRQDYFCALEGGESSVIIPRGEYVDVILVLEAERFPEDVPQDPPMFSDLRYMMGIED